MSARLAFVLFAAAAVLAAPFANPMLIVGGEAVQVVNCQPWAACSDEASTCEAPAAPASEVR